MTDELEMPQGGKSVEDLGNEAMWFAIHTAIAIATMIVIVMLMAVLHPDKDASIPKLVATALAFLAPMVVGFAIARKQKNQVARYVWIAGLLLFCAMCVWVIDLPTGPGMCEHCVSIVEKLRRTFFSVDEGSGLLGGWGLMLGCWVPLSLIGYAIGAKLGLDS